MMNIPKIGSVWQHKNGNTYTVLKVANTGNKPDGTTKFLILFDTNTQSDRLDEYPICTLLEDSNGNFWCEPKGTEFVFESPAMVIYQGSNGNVWSRTLERWHPSMGLLYEEVLSS